MAITLVPMTCPQCGATIDAPVNQDECFCTYCGAKIIINNENVKTININKNVTKTTVDEAKIAESERKNMLIKIVAGFAVAILVALIVLVVLAINGNSNAGAILGGLAFIIFMVAIMYFTRNDN